MRAADGVGLQRTAERHEPHGEVGSVAVAESPPEREASLGQQELIVAATREVIAAVAPDELPLVTPIAAAYFANPDDTLRARTSKDESLGFGVPGDAAQLLTPIALAVIARVVSFLAEEIRASVQAEAPDLVHDLVRRLFKKLRRAETQATAPSTHSEAQASGPTLTRQQLTHVREIALEKGRQLGLTSTRAELLADSVVGGLAVAV
jgi:hypothetical protein